MADKSGNIVIYAKLTSFEVDEDGMVHVLFHTHGMDIRIIQTRANFFKSAARAQKFGRELSEQQGDVVAFTKGGKPTFREETDRY